MPPQVEHWRGRDNSIGLGSTFSFSSIRHVPWRVRQRAVEFLFRPHDVRGTLSCQLEPFSQGDFCACRGRKRSLRLYYEVCWAQAALAVVRKNCVRQGSGPCNIVTVWPPQAGPYFPVWKSCWLQRGSGRMGFWRTTGPRASHSAPSAPGWSSGDTSFGEIGATECLSQAMSRGESH